ncbi:MAG: transcriptional regulator [Thiohalocapsa sp.]|jgi:predicted transcriptional regulator
MQQRTLTITVDANARQALRACAVAAFQADGYLGETLNFETPGAFFGRFTERRWALVQTLMGAGELSLRETARRLGRDITRVSEDVAVLVELGLLERTAKGGVLCPFQDIEVHMRLQRQSRAAA